MNRRKYLTASFVLFFVFGVCGTAMANSISSYVWFWPGIISVTLVYAFPASLLAAFIERPFYSTAGLKKRALVLSLRANFLSTLVGILLIPVGYPAIYTIGPIWCVIAFGVSCVVEISYLRRFAVPFSTGWAVGGNAVSSFVLMILPPIALNIKHSYPSLARSLEPHEIWLNLASLAASLLVFVGSFFWRVAKPKTITPILSVTDNLSEKNAESAEA